MLDEQLTNKINMQIFSIIYLALVAARKFRCVGELKNHSTNMDDRTTL